MQAPPCRPAGSDWNDGATDRAMAALRQERDQKLAETDWWAMPDSPDMTEAQRKYRSDLRDFPSTVDNILNVDR